MKKLDIHNRRRCIVQGNLFEEAINRNMDSRDFIEKYMTSGIALSIDLPAYLLQHSGEFYFLDIMDANLCIKRSDNIIPSEILYWIGYIYGYWHYYKEISSKEIYEIADFDTMCSKYVELCTLSPSVAINILIESYKRS